MSSICPKCGQEIPAVGGKSTTEKVCKHCGQPLAVAPDADEPTSVNATPIRSQAANDDRIGWWALAIVVVIILFVWLLMPSINMGPRESPHRTACLHHEKQIILALFAYETKKGHFPPAFVADRNGKPMHSWRVLILPYLDRRDLYDQYDFNEPWNGPHNRKLADKMPDVFGCPSNKDSPNCTNFAMLVGPHAFSPGPKGRTLDEISAADGTSEMLMIVEASDAKINWLEPRDLNVEEMSFVVNKDGKEISSHHPGGAVVQYCDGRTSILPGDVKPETLKALTTVDGGETLDENSL